MQIIIILVLRYMFIWQNKRRDRAVAEGRVEYDAIATAMEDLSDWKNPAFRYVTASSPSLTVYLTPNDLTLVNVSTCTLKVSTHSFMSVACCDPCNINLHTTQYMQHVHSYVDVVTTKTSKVAHEPHIILRPKFE